MFHFFPGAQKTGFLLCILSMMALISGNFTTLKAEEIANQIVSITSHNVGTQVEIRIKASSPLITTVYELPKPSRIIIDVADAKLAEGISKKQEIDKNITLAISIIADAKPSITRLEFVLAETLPYTTAQEGNDIILSINTKSSKTTNVEQKSTIDTKDQVGGLINQKKNIENQLPDIDPLGAKLLPKTKERQMEDSFNFSGYKKERITVDFQKMDLHNVFNFLRQVSGVNIVVDETVQGSLTLVLDDVPWDFALDIILNLKGLEKEERFNTLVIYPKGKGFKWPEQAKNNLSFEADTRVMKKEVLTLKQQDGQSLQVEEAKQMMIEAKDLEKQEKFETAVQLYEHAFEKWPDNSKLANKIASLYLVQLNQNAKSLYFSKKALEKDVSNSNAALNAAIASANMQDRQKAQQYFDMSTSMKTPSKEALLSHAVFSEEQHDYAGALRMLEKQDALYGNDLNAMIAVARIYDKMGKREKATEKYQSILLSGFNIPQDLSKFIKARVALKQTM